jgi:hypothetical protein
MFCSFGIILTLITTVGAGRADLLKLLARLLRNLLLKWLFNLVVTDPGPIIKLLISSGLALAIIILPIILVSLLLVASNRLIRNFYK